MKKRFRFRVKTNGKTVQIERGTLNQIKKRLGQIIKEIEKGMTESEDWSLEKIEIHEEFRQFVNNQLYCIICGERLSYNEEHYHKIDDTEVRIN